ncbi:hypothetical protein [Halalkalibacterium ligniniphilum]|uniref:hypothetical protein n=1 Tax=Halalkalibacterium ligniniphilum TaxID=1134413 RepID=UPI000344BFC1|nr:hypothetical protein [Halalkalibacterium ligniniphilum]
MIIFFLTVGLLLAGILYRRYYPVKGVPCIDKEGSFNGSSNIVDIRDFAGSGSGSKPSARTLHIPYAYLKRHYREISQEPIHVIAANKLELNLGLRFLMKKGFHVTGYSLIDCPCQQKNAS